MGACLSHLHHGLVETDEAIWARPPSKEFVEIMSQLHPGLSLPPPRLEADFRMKVVLSSNVATMAIGGESRKLTTFTEGVWSGNIGTGIVVVGFGSAKT